MTGVALVTGGGRGIGAAVAQALAETGLPIVIADLDRETAEKTAAGIAEHGGIAIGKKCDVSVAAEVEKTVDWIEQSLGPIEVLVNAAGVLRPAKVVDIHTDDWDATFAVNARGSMLVSRSVSRRMCRRRSGSIVTIASNAAGVPRVGMAAYAASKAASAMFAKCLGLEVAEFGVRVNVVCPGSTDTAMQRDLWPDEEVGRGAAIGGDPKTYRVGIPLGRIADPVDVAAAVVFMASPAARHITMQELYVDGGASLR